MKIKLSGVKNIRDFSEYGLDGYIRSAHLNALTEKDAEVLTGRYRLGTIIDLRTTKEVTEKPDVTIPGVKYLHVPIFDEAIPGVSHEEKSDGLSELEKKLPDMPEFYRALVTEEKYLANIKKVTEIISDPAREGAVLWHCTEGKDRCGIISAWFLLSHGVGREEVLRDYLKTNRENRIKAWEYYFLILISGKGRRLAAKVRDAFLAKKKYLEPILDVIETL